MRECLYVLCSFFVLWQLIVEHVYRMTAVSKTSIAVASRKARRYQKVECSTSYILCKKKKIEVGCVSLLTLSFCQIETYTQRV